MGTSSAINTDPLEPIAHNGQPGGDPIDAIQASFVDLEALLVGLANQPSGFLFGEGNTVADAAGADGADTLTVNIEGTDYVYDVAANHITGGTVDEDGSQLTVETASGGTWTIDMSSGGYSYAIGDTFTPNTEETFSYTLVDGDGDGATANVTVELKGPDVEVLSLGNLAVSESYIPVEGNQQGAGDATDSDALVFKAADPTNFALSVGAANFGSVQDIVDAVGTSVDTEHGKLTFNNINPVGAGADADEYTLEYTYEVTSAEDHALEDGKDIIQVTLVDANGQSAGDQTITVEIADDVPVTFDNSVSVVSGEIGAQFVQVTLDVSGSMFSRSGTDNFDRASAAINALAAKYESLGEFEMQIVLFARSATHSPTTFSTAAEVAAYLDSVPTIISDENLGSSTDYLDAVTEAQTGWTAALATPELANATKDNSLAIFVSDGKPNGSGFNNNAVATWENFVDNNFSKAVAFGTGAGPSDSDLRDVAHTPGGTGGDTDDEIYQTGNDAQAFIDALVALVPPAATINGNVVTDVDPVDGVDLAGADGWGTTKLVSVQWVGVGGDLVLHTFTDVDTSFEIETDAGKVVIHDTGDYSFTGVSNILADVTSTIEYVAQDADGTASAPAILSVSTTLLPVPPVEIPVALAEEDVVVATDDAPPADESAPLGDGEAPLQTPTSGEDTLIGIDGTADVFAWSLGDGSASGDLIIGFNTDEDAINIADLLGGLDTTDLTQYLEVGLTEDGASTVIKVSASGDFAAADQVITVQDVDLFAGVDFADMSAVNSALQSLVDAGKLIAD
jgi:hypothetical protein